MIYHQITITFNQDLIPASRLRINTATTPLVEQWKIIRDAPFQVTTGVPTATPGERSAMNYLAAFSLDYPGIEATRVLNVVTLRSQVVEFTTASCTYGSPLDMIPADVVFNITSVEVAEFNITDISFIQAASPCSDVRIVVETSHDTAQMTSPVSQTIGADQFYFDYQRGATILLSLLDGDGIIVTQALQLPSSLNASNFTASVVGSPNGGTATINNTGLYGLALEYSLDGEDWQEINVFGGLAEGDYTLYVRDQLGCSTTLEFSVSAFGLTAPWFYISKSNSIRFAERMDFNLHYKTDENTLGEEVDVSVNGVAHCGCQKVQTADVITTQFKSNYETNTAVVIREDGTEVNVPILQKSNNIGLKDRRDARQYSLGDGKTGVYFLSGNIYNYDTGVVSGTHALAGTLPLWAISGNYITIDNVWFSIEQIIFDENKNAYVIVISMDYTGLDVAVIAGSIYNQFPYEVYEFVIDMSTYPDQDIQVRINAEDDHFEDVEWLSEKQIVRARQADTVDINYWNDDNTDMFYATGIRHRIRIPLTKKEGGSDEESETHKTDTTAVLLNAEMYEVDKFIFEPQTKEIWRKMTIALSHKNVTIDGVRYVKSGNFETDGPLDKSNLYVLEATMIKTANVYNADSAESLGFNPGNVEIPGLVQAGNGFVRY